MWFLFLACRPTDTRAPQAMAQALDSGAPLDRAWVDCEALSEPMERGRCELAALESHDALSSSTCHDLEAGTWRDECFFVLAESLAERGRIDQAAAACAASGFASQCRFHMVRESAVRAASRAPVEAEAELRPWLSEDAPNAASFFWQAWADRRLDLGEPVDVQGCELVAWTQDACVHVLRRDVYQATLGEWPQCLDAPPRPPRGPRVRSGSRTAPAGPASGGRAGG